MPDSLGFYIGKSFIPYYGLMIIIGVFAAAVVGIIQCRIHKLDLNDFIIMAAMGAGGGMIGAKLLYLIVSWNSIDFSRIFDPEYLKMIIAGGFVFYGGLLGGLIMIFVTQVCFKINCRPYLEKCIMVLPIAHGFGRIGCSIVGCCYGIPYDGPFAVVYTDSVVAPAGVSLFPVQITEALLEFMIAAILLIYVNVNKTAKKHSFLLYLIMYSVVRFILEYLRYDAERGVYGMFSTSQWISVVLFAISTGLLIRNMYLNRRKRNL